MTHTNTVTREASPPLLEIHDATVTRGGAHLLDGLSLRVDEGQHTAILGPNGSGKSSLVKLITRQHYPRAREGGRPPVTVFGRERWDVSALRSLLGVVSADLHQTFVADGTLRGLDAVLSGFFASQGLARHHTVTAEMQARARTALAQVGAEPLADRPLETLSTGEARRVLIARALVFRPRALLLDEPTAGLDLVARRRFLETLGHVARQGTTVILVTHHVEEVLPEIGRVVLMKAGRVFQDGPAREVLTTPRLSALFDAPVRVRAEGDYYAADVLPSSHSA